MECGICIKWWKRITGMERIPKGVYPQEFREQAAKNYVPETNFN